MVERVPAAVEREALQTADAGQLAVHKQGHALPQDVAAIVRRSTAAAADAHGSVGAHGAAAPAQRKADAAIIRRVPKAAGDVFGGAAAARHNATFARREQETAAAEDASEEGARGNGAALGPQAQEAQGIAPLDIGKVIGVAVNIDGAVPAHHAPGIAGAAGGDVAAGNAAALVRRAENAADGQGFGQAPVGGGAALALVPAQRVPQAAAGGAPAAEAADVGALAVAQGNDGDAAGDAAGPAVQVLLSAVQKHTVMPVMLLRELDTYQLNEVMANCSLRVFLCS